MSEDEQAEKEGDSQHLRAVFPNIFFFKSAWMEDRDNKNVDQQHIWLIKLNGMLYKVGEITTW